MLFRTDDLQAIVAGRMDLAFRRWERPAVKAGGTQRTPLGILSIVGIDEIDDADLREEDAKRAGYSSLNELLVQLEGRTGKLYRIELRWKGDDPRIELRNQAEMSVAECKEIHARLARYDKASRYGSWTVKTLELIQQHPETRAADLAQMADWEKQWFKTNVRKLKNLGLTESLGIGYRLSPRGKALLAADSWKREQEGL